MTWFDSLAHALLKRARLLGAMVLVATALAVAGVANLRTEIDFSGLINPHSEAAESMRAYQARFGRLSFDEVFLLEADTLADDAALDALEELIIGFHFVEGVERVFSLFSLPGPGTASAWLASPDLAALDAGERLERMRQSHPLAPQLLSSGLDATLVVVAPERGTDRSALLVGLEAERLAAAPGFRLSAVGLPEVHAAIGQELLRDLRVLIPAAIIICALLTVLLFRSWRALVVCALPPVTAVFWFMGYLGARQISIDPVMGSLPVVVIVLCFSQCVHLYFAALRRMQDGLAPRDITGRALAETLPAMVLTSLTTIIAFLSILLPGAPQLDKMAMAGVGGMLISLAAGVFVAPLLMVFLGAPEGGARQPKGIALMIAPATRLARRGVLVAFMALALIVVLVSLQSQSSVGFRYTEYLPTNSEVASDLRRMEALGLGSDRLFAVIESRPVLAEGIETGAPPGLENASVAAQVLWGGGEDPAEWFAALESTITVAPLAAGDGGGHALPVQLPLTGGQEPASAALERIEARLAEAGLAPVSHLVGPNKALLTEGPVLVGQLRMGLYATILSITLLIGLVFRSWRVALIALVPNLIPIMGVESWLVLSGRELSIMTVIALTVAFGIAVDDTLHMLNRYRLGAGLPHARRVDRALSDAGAPMIATTAILLGGLAVTLTSAIPGAVLFGGLIALAVALALLADLFILPGLLHWGAR